MSVTIYRLPKVKTISGLSRSTIYSEVAKGTFPAPVPLTDEGRAVGWDSTAVDAWVAARVQMARPKVPVKPELVDAPVQMVHPKVGTQ